MWHLRPQQTWKPKQGEPSLLVPTISCSIPLAAAVEVELSSVSFERQAATPAVKGWQRPRWGQWEPQTRKTEELPGQTALRAEIKLKFWREVGFCDSLTQER